MSGAIARKEQEYPYAVLCGNTVEDGRGRPVKCDYWLGESPEPLVYVESVSKGAEVTIPPPRDVRICKGCGGVAIFVPRAGLDRLRSAAVS